MAALGANLLKPCIEWREGKMLVGKKYRGSFERCILQYVEDRLKGRDDLRLGRVFITHTGCAPELVKQVRKAVLRLAPFEEVLETRAGCTVSRH